MANLNDYGALMLASRMRKLSEQMYNGVDQSYKAAGIDFPSRCSSLLLLLRDNGPTPITTLAAQIGQTHPAVIQLSRKLLEAGVVSEQSDPADTRRRLLALSDHGRALMDNMAPLWDDILAAVDVALDGHTDALMATLGRLETRLQETPFADIIAGRRRDHRLRAAARGRFPPPQHRMAGALFLRRGARQRRAVRSADPHPRRRRRHLPGPAARRHRRRLRADRGRRRSRRAVEDGRHAALPGAGRGPAPDRARHRRLPGRPQQAAVSGIEQQAGDRRAAV